MSIKNAWVLREADPKSICRAFSVVMDCIVWEPRRQPAIQLDYMVSAPGEAWSSGKPMEVERMK
ncbi:hypothetical protein [Halomonas sp. 25-S5]|uniref:hypothetical protein n=1 Tax=Halomonas sp. 25-S5 TaxID=2994065 RepID=UPI0024698A48|nr:hypothetical protein [Halomonas sp. 25-S5]